MRKAPNYKFLDLAHRGVVVTCIGLTLYGSWLLGSKFYRYFTVIKPQRQQEELRIIQELDKLDTSTLLDNAKSFKS